MKTLSIILIVMALAACSTTSSNVREIKSQVDLTDMDKIRLAFDVTDLRTSSQVDGNLYTLLETPEDVKNTAESVAKLYGFQVVELGQADFHVHITEAVPDNGDCLSDLAVMVKGLSYVPSLLTLGLIPAFSGHCLIVNASLYSYSGGERVAAGDFMSKEGLVYIYAGATELNNYQFSVERKDEARALEASLGGLLNQLVENGVFRFNQLIEEDDYYYY